LEPLRQQGISIFIIKTEKKTRVPLLPEDALRILSKVSDETYRLIGLDPDNARPEWMILTVIPVPPPCVRPSVQMDINGKGEDDLTHMLGNIVRYNNLVQKNIRSTSWVDYREQLQICVTNYLDNDVSSVAPATQKGGRPIKSLTERMKGKEGRIRGKLLYFYLYSILTY
jgi:DNA-directed RNA polymerase beta' subunit